MAAAIRTALAVTALLLTCSPVIAQPSDTESRLRQQLRDATVQLREAQDENATLRAQQQALQQQLQSAASAAKTAAPDHSGALRKVIRDRDARIAGLRQQLSDLEQQQAQLQDAYRKAAGLLRQREVENSQLREQAQQLDAAYRQAQEQGRSCDAKNTQLITISSELLRRYQDKGVWSALLDAEPFTGIHRVQLEKIAQDYDIKIKDLTLKPAPAK